MAIADRTVAEVMQEEVVTLDASDRLDLVDDIMRLGRVRHLPVLEDARVVGVVSQRDLLACSLSRSLEFEPAQRRAFNRSVSVSEAMSRDVVSIEPGASLREAAETMLKRQIGCLPVVRPDGTFVGLVTETDLVRSAYCGRSHGEEGEVVQQDSRQGMGERLEKDLDQLRAVRDEIRVQLHLAKAEARDRWEELEGRFHEVEGRVRRVLQEAEQPAEEIGETLRAVFEDLRDGYRRVKDSL